MGICGPLVSRMQQRIEDKYGRWCGFALLGKDNREIIVLTAYNVPLETPAGDDTLHAQQTLLYLLDGEVDPKPRKNSIRDLHTQVKATKENNQDLILMGDFNEVVGDEVCSWVWVPMVEESCSVPYYTLKDQIHLELH